jgi:hypothetical protein
MFTEHLTANLTLGAGSVTSAVASGDVDAFRVSVHAWGFEAEVTFSTWPERGVDTVFPSLSAPGVVSARLEIKSTRTATPAPDPIVVKGVVTSSRVVEHVLDSVSQKPVRRREITIKFADAAQVLWKQHYPCDLGADLALGDMIDRQILEGIQLERSWQRLGLESPIVCLGLGATLDRGADAGASFYDFLIWYVHAHAGVFTYDATANKYTLSDAKPGRGTANLMSAQDAASSRVVAPDGVRHSVRLLDAQATAPTTETLANEDAVAGVTRDVLRRPQTADELTDLKTCETSRLAHASPGPSLEVELARVPTVTCLPGTLVKNPTTHGWTGKTWSGNREWRVFELELDARATGAEETTGLTARLYEASGRVRLELKTDMGQRLPSYREPEYPVRAEGRIVAAGGEETDRRWQVIEDKRTGGSVYTVEVVLWNQKIIVPFVPDQLPGQLFFPAYKKATVLVELSLHSAELVRHLDWGPSVRFAQDTQGDHILLGFDTKSETTIGHTYVDSKPELLVKRFDNGDQQTIHLLEGVLTMKVMEQTSTASALPTYDVTLQVESARGELNGKIGGGVNELSGKAGGAIAGLGGAVGGAAAEVQGELQSTTSDVSSKIDDANGEIDGLKASLAGGAAPAVAAAQSAAAELKAALE